MVNPGFRNRLLGRIGPRIAVMKVHHQVHPQCLHPLRHRQQGKLVAVATTGIHPDAHADGRHLVVVLQQFQALTLLTVAVVELHAP